MELGDKSRPAWPLPANSGIVSSLALSLRPLAPREKTGEVLPGFPVAPRSEDGESKGRRVRGTCCWRSSRVVPLPGGQASPRSSIAQGQRERGSLWALLAWENCWEARDPGRPKKLEAPRMLLQSLRGGGGVTGKGTSPPKPGPKVAVVGNLRSPRKCVNFLLKHPTSSPSLELYLRPSNWGRCRIKTFSPHRKTSGCLSRGSLSFPGSLLDKAI